MHYATHDASMAKVERWIIESAGRPDDGALQPDTHLLDEEYLDSLALMSLILFIEELRGTPIAEEDMSVQNFVSLRQIEKVFFSGRGTLAAMPAPDCKDLDERRGTCMR